MANESVERKLAAIVAADVVGYSRLMNADETGTLVRLTALRQDLIEPQISAYGGRIVKLMGDGVLAEFASVVDALACAVEMQRAIAEANQALVENQRIQFRIGIHLGDIIVQGDDLYGDGVNIAARLEPLADPDSICISQAALDAVGNKLPLDYEDKGAQQLKNIAKPVRVYQVQVPADALMPKGGHITSDKPARPVAKHRRFWSVTALVVILLFIGIGFWFVYQRAPSPETVTMKGVDRPSALPEQPSIAVLPFTNMSDDPEQEYFSDGISEDLITDLSKLRGLIVIARNSSFVYKGKAVDVRQVGKELGVRHVLEGSVRKAGEQVRINAQLVDTATGDHVWAERYDRPLADIFAVQDEIRQQIVAALDVTLSEGEQARVWRGTTDNPEAYELFLRGREDYLRFSPEANYRAQQALEKAVALDPNFAEAWVKLGWVHSYNAFAGWSESATVSVEKAWECADRALALDDSLSDAHALLFELYGYRGDSENASKAIAKAVALNPNGAKNVAIYAFELANQHKIEEALASIEKAMRLNPNPPTWYLNVKGHIYIVAKRYDDAAIALKECTGRNPEYLSCASRLTIAYMGAGREDEARRQAKEVLRIKPEFSIADWGGVITDPTERERQSMLLRKAGLSE